jgi:deoxyribodipyrimidine photo-lyase
MRIFWHRRDLRTMDNVGLSAAASTADPGEVIPVYVYDKGLLSTLGERQRAFVLRGVKRLQERYRGLGTDLLLRSGEPAEVLTEVADEHGVDSVYYNRHYRKERKQRAEEAADRLRESGVSTQRYTDLVLVGPGGWTSPTRTTAGSTRTGRRYRSSRRTPNRTRRGSRTSTCP